MHGLQGIDQHARNVVAVAQYTQRVGVHFIEGERVFGRRHGVARAGLHIVPPAVVGAGKAHNFGLARVVARQAHRLHHRLGTRHVKRHFVHAGNLAQALHVVEDNGVVGAQHHAQWLGQGSAFGHAGFVVVRAEQVDAVGTGHIDEAITVQIGQPHTAALAPKAAQLDVLRQQSTELVGHTVLTDELQVRQHRARCIGLRQRLGTLVFQELAELRQCGASALFHRQRCAVHGVPGRIGVGVAGNQLRDPLGHAQVTTQRGVLGQGELQALPRFGKSDQTQ